MKKKTRKNELVGAIRAVYDQTKKSLGVPNQIIMDADDFSLIAKHHGMADSWIESYIERHTIKPEKE